MLLLVHRKFAVKITREINEQKFFQEIIALCYSEFALDCFDCDNVIYNAKRQDILGFFQGIIDLIAPLFKAYGYAIVEYGLFYGIMISVLYSLLALVCMVVVLFLIVVLGGFLTAFFVPVLAIVFYVNGVASIACIMMIIASILATIGTFNKKLGILIETEKEKEKEENFDYSYSKEMEKYDVSILDKIKIGARNTFRWFLITTVGIVYFFILEIKKGE